LAGGQRDDRADAAGQPVADAEPGEGGAAIHRREPRRLRRPDARRGLPQRPRRGGTGAVAGRRRQLRPGGAARRPDAVERPRDVERAGHPPAVARHCHRGCLAEMKSLPLAARIYVCAIIAIGAALFVAFFPTHFVGSPWPFLTLLLMSSVTSVFKVNLPLARR